MIDGAAEQLRSAPPTLADRNVVTGGFDGIVIDNPGANNNVIQNNMIGVSPGRLAQWGGSCTGIDYNVGPKGNMVGGTGPRQRNVIDG